MSRHLVLSICLALATSTAVAQDIEPTAEEREMLVEMRKQWKANGLGEMTPEQEQTMLRQQREMRVRMMSMLGGMKQQAGALAEQMQAQPSVAAPVPVAAPSPASEQLASVSREQLLADVQARIAAGPFVVFARRPDGFNVDGRPFLDPDGRIVDFGGDGVSGMVTYIVDTGEGSALVKLMNARSDAQPMLLGYLTERGDAVSFQSVAGETAGGLKARPTSRGLVLLRDGSAVSYDWEKGAKAIALPEGFRMAEFQNGDVGGTRHVLLERVDDRRVKPDKVLTDAVSIFRTVTGQKDKAFDYALFNVDTGATVPLNISMARNEVNKGYGCTPNGLGRKCRSWETANEIYEQDGRPNYSHYFWSLEWQNTAHGPLATAIENGLREVNVIRLGDGARFNAFDRAMGIQYFTTETLPSGSMKVTAYWAFKGHPVEDVGTLLAGGVKAAP
ncbi:hypothetical protein ACFFGH_18445 [Lysobacter korlensis]|uniref:Uncharacterized protein n=1 Tax=Lysobacter korlensis TaxID=553636 RepID=A0ABV6RTA2_9GAMM